jgi:hypothetical protein
MFGKFIRSDTMINVVKTFCRLEVNVFCEFIRFG